MSYRSQFHAAGLPFSRDLEQLGAEFSRAFAVPAAGRFEDLLTAIDASEIASQTVEDAQNED